MSSCGIQYKLKSSNAVAIWVHLKSHKAVYHNLYSSCIHAIQSQATFLSASAIQGWNSVQHRTSDENINLNIHATSEHAQMQFTKNMQRPAADLMQRQNPHKSSSETTKALFFLSFCACFFVRCSSLLDELEELELFQLPVRTVTTRLQRS